MSKKSEYKLIITQAKTIRDLLLDILNTNENLTISTRTSFENTKEKKILSKLSALPLANLNQLTGEEIDYSLLAKSGINSLSSIYLIESDKLVLMTGLEKSIVEKIKEATLKLYTDLSDLVPLGIDYENISKDELSLLRNIKESQSLGAQYQDLLPEIKTLALKLDEHIKNVEIVDSSFKWLASSDLKDKVSRSVDALNKILEENETDEIVEVAKSATQSLKVAEKVDTLEDFKSNASDYFSAIEKSFGKEYNSKGTYIDDDLVAKINAREFDQSKVMVTLRKYQVFGIKFALTQNRVILGDEMGLGKTLQATGVLTQRIKEGGTHFIIVCPKAVLVNWQREVESRTDIRLIKIHGSQQNTSYQQWLAKGGVAITTFDTLKNLSLEDKAAKNIKLNTIIADEAHFVKNPMAGRTRAMFGWVKKAENVLFMTGTPLENRTQEFVEISSLVDDKATGKLHNAYLYQGPELFRKQVAPIYLRRNLEEVVSELPELIETTEYCTFEGADFDRYELYATLRNWMGMRRSAYIPLTPDSTPDKIEKIISIVNDAYSKNKKVVIFSYFKDVLNLVHKSIGDSSFYPITGATSSNDRQKALDEFTDSKEPCTLIGQIQALGTGLNIQAASVVIICEPQIKPSLEVQAIARAHRMGQVNKVYVYRLVVTDPSVEETVEEYVTRLLARKIAEFDAYARKSNLADASANLVEAVNLDNDFFSKKKKEKFTGKYAKVDFYEVLQVDVNSSEEEIKASYKKLVKLNHPDVNESKHEFVEKLKEINLAYEILTDSKMKERYEKIRNANSR